MHFPSKLILLSCSMHHVYKVYCGILCNSSSAPTTAFICAHTVILQTKSVTHARKYLRWKQMRGRKWDDLVIHKLTLSYSIKIHFILMDFSCTFYILLCSSRSLQRRPRDIFSSVALKEA